jgi:pimeloyl-ACP methyl ester carboxylesterase
MGGAVGVLRARSDPRIRKLVSLAGMVHVQRFMERHFGQLVPGRDGMLGRERCPLTRAFLDDARRIDTVLPAAAELRIPWLLVHGTSDEFVPVSESIEAHAANAERAELVTLDHVDHRFSGVHDELVRIVTTWLSTRCV